MINLKLLGIAVALIVIMTALGFLRGYCLGRKRVRELEEALQRERGTRKRMDTIKEGNDALKKTTNSSGRFNDSLSVLRKLKGRDTGD